MDLAPTAVDIKNITHGLEGKKGDADGEGDALQREFWHLENRTNGVKVGDGEIQVLVDKKEGQVKNYRQRQIEPGAPPVPGRRGVLPQLLLLLGPGPVDEQGKEVVH